LSKIFKNARKFISGIFFCFKKITVVAFCINSKQNYFYKIYFFCQIIRINACMALVLQNNIKSDVFFSNNSIRKMICKYLIFKKMRCNYSKAILFLISLLVVSLSFSNVNEKIKFKTSNDKILTKSTKNSKKEIATIKEFVGSEVGLKKQRPNQNAMAWTSADTCPTCDFDGDGIANNVDIDDDNDGVVDTLEMGASPVSSLIVPNASSVSHYWSNQSAFASRTYDENVTLTTTFGADSYGTDQALVASNSWFSGAPIGTGVSYALKPFIADIVYTFASPVVVDGVAIWNPDSPNYGGEDNGIKEFNVTVKFADNSTQVFGPYHANLSNAVQTYAFGSMLYNVTGITLNVFDGWYGNVASTATSAAAAYAAGTLNTGYNTCLREFRAMCSTNYYDIDTDGDGFPNRMDLDSDGDGCPDAKEAGVTGTLLTGNVINGMPNTTTSIANAIAQGTYGTNGLANSLENNDTVAATTSYTSTYVFYATHNTLSACLDSDSDGVKNLADIDDDNDGIVDAVESATCFYTATEMGVPVLITTEEPTTGVLTNLYDNSTGTYLLFPDQLLQLQ